MTQREIMEEIYQKLHDSDIEVKNRIANGESCSVFAKVKEGLYEEMKNLAKQNGFEVGCFENLWLAAVKRYTADLGISPDQRRID